MKREAEIIKQIIKRHGEVINVRERPEVILDIIRRFAVDLGEMPDGGLPPGGTPPAPPPGPDSGFQGRVTNEEIMKQLLKLSRDVSKLAKQVGGG